MCSEAIYIAGRYNKYNRDLSQSPWFDKDDARVKHSVQELIEDGLNKFLKFDKSIFSSSGREDVDVRMLGRGRPFVFRMMNPWNESTYNDKTMKQIQTYINTTHGTKIRVRDLQVVTKDSVSKNLKDGEEEKTKEYRALCCCSKKLTEEDIERIGRLKDVYIDQKTPIRVLHRRSQAVRRRKIFNLDIQRTQMGEFESVKQSSLDKVFTLKLLTEAGTYIKEFVHGDFGRTKPDLSSLLSDCETDLIELDVMEVHLDWPPEIEEPEIPAEPCTPLDSSNKMERTEINLQELYDKGLKSMKDAESMPRGDSRQDSYIKARRLLEDAMDLVESLSLFSDNESIEDVATTDLKYLLIPAYLSKIALSAECEPNRLETFTRAEILLRKFLIRCLQYGLGNEKIEVALKDVENKPGQQLIDLNTAAQSRNEKIENFKKMKLLESQLEELERRISLEQDVDEETHREYYMVLLNKWINDSIDSLEREVKSALMFERVKGSTGVVEFPTSTSKTATTSALANTITIVKDNLQKKVFGLGYPSLPTVTVDEFITKKINDGELAFDAHKEVYANSLQGYAEKPNLRREQEELSDTEREDKEDRDDAEELARKRRWDEFKDENPRGSGNRYNQG